MNFELFTYVGYHLSVTDYHTQVLCVVLIHSALYFIVLNIIHRYSGYFTAACSLMFNLPFQRLDKLPKLAHISRQYLFFRVLKQKLRTISLLIVAPALLVASPCIVSSNNSLGKIW